MYVIKKGNQERFWTGWIFYQADWIVPHQILSIPSLRRSIGGFSRNSYAASEHPDCCIFSGVGVERKGENKKALDFFGGPFARIILWIHYDPKSFTR